MVIQKNELFVFFNKLPDARKYWKWFLSIGILLIALGGLAIGYAKWATEFTVILLGCLLLGAGVLQIINGAYAAKWAGFSLSILMGLLYIIAGALCIFKPMESASAISVLIGALLLLGGLFRLISAIRFHFDNWGWVVFNGLTAVLLGILILIEWPSSGLWVIGVFVGIDLLLIGCYWVGLSIAASKR